MQRPRPLAFALAAACLLALTSPAAGQTGGQAAPSAPSDTSRRTFDPVGRMLDQRADLKLTDDQVRKLEAIRAKNMAKHQALIDELRRDREKRSAVRASMDSTRTEVMAILTPEQQRQVSEMRKKWWKERRGKHGGDGHGHGDHDDD